MESRLATRINPWLDSLPRTRLFAAAHASPAFRGMGVAGYHAALVVTLGLGLWTGRSLLVLATVSAACALSFFAYAHLRRWISRRETYVLLEHVWIAELVSAGVLRALREPILPYLDVVSIGLVVFLAWGRIGCSMAGCCHGHPSSIGLVYDGACARDGFPEHLVGIRLFPVPLLESLALLGIALAGAILLGTAREGTALAWVLVAYSVVRFGLEGLRADPRPHLFGLSQARWMSLVELAAAVLLVDRAVPIGPERIAAAVSLLILAIVGVTIAARHRRRSTDLLAPAHVGEIRTIVRDAAASLTTSTRPPRPPEIARTAHRASVGVSLVDEGETPMLHVSLSLPPERADLRLLCDLASRALPELSATSGRVRPTTLLHVLVPSTLPSSPRSESSPGDALYGHVLRRLQTPPEERTIAPAALSPVAPAPVVPTPAKPEAPAPNKAPPPPEDVPRSPWDPVITDERAGAQATRWKRSGGAS